MIDLLQRLWRRVKRARRVAGGRVAIGRVAIDRSAIGRSAIGRSAIGHSAMALAAALAAVALQPMRHARAAEFPPATLRILVPVAAGGPLDLTTRLFGEHLAAALKIAVVVENRPGAATLLAARAIVQAPASGATLLLSTSSLSSYSALVREPGLELARDLTFISLVARIPQFLAVSAAGGIDAVSTLVARARARPEALNYASYGNANRVMSELFNRSLGIRLTHVAYSGSAPAAQALVAGDVALLLDAMSTLKPLVDGGKLRVLAVTEAARVPAFPGIPTLRETGFSMPEFPVWYGLVGPAGLAPEVTERLAVQVAAFAQSPAARARLEAFGFVLDATTPAEFRRIALAGETVFRDVAGSLGIRPE